MVRASSPRCRNFCYQILLYVFYICHQEVNIQRSVMCIAGVLYYGKYLVGGNPFKRVVMPFVFYGKSTKVDVLLRFKIVQSLLKI